MILSSWSDNEGSGNLQGCGFSFLWGGVKWLGGEGEAGGDEAGPGEKPGRSLSSCSNGYYRKKVCLDDGGKPSRNLIYCFIGYYTIALAELPEHAPARFADRETLWNEVQKVEKRSGAQFAREIEVALPNELWRDEQIRCVRRYIRENFVSKGNDRRLGAA